MDKFNIFLGPILAILLGIFLLVGEKNSYAAKLNDSSPMTIRISNDSGSALVEIYDNPMGRDFISLLPIESTFEDYANAEKIAYLPRKLATSGGILSSKMNGDFTYFVPWGNLAIFYKGIGNSSSLYNLGEFKSGKSWLVNHKNSFKVKIELVKEGEK